MENKIIPIFALMFVFAFSLVSAYPDTWNIYSPSDSSSYEAGSVPDLYIETEATEYYNAWYNLTSSCFNISTKNVYEWDGMYLHENWSLPTDCYANYTLWAWYDDTASITNITSITFEVTEATAVTPDIYYNTPSLPPFPPYIFSSYTDNFFYFDLWTFPDYANVSYSLDGASNVSVGTGFVTFNVTDLEPFVQHEIIVYANNSGLFDSDIFLFTYDPAISIIRIAEPYYRAESTLPFPPFTVTPENITTFTSSPISINASAYVVNNPLETIWANVTLWKFSIDGGVTNWTSTADPETLIDEFNVTSGNGNYTLTIWATDIWNETVSATANFIYEEATIEEEEITPSVEDTAIYQVLASSGAGLGIFFQILGQALPVLLIGFAIVVIFVTIGYAVANAIVKFKAGGKK